jgi:hypothetical protein
MKLPSTAGPRLAQYGRSPFYIYKHGKQDPRYDAHAINQTKQKSSPNATATPDIPNDPCGIIGRFTNPPSPKRGECGHTFAGGSKQEKRPVYRSIVAVLRHNGPAYVSLTTTVTGIAQRYYASTAPATRARITAHKMTQQPLDLSRAPSPPPWEGFLPPVLGSSSSKSAGRMLICTTLGLSGTN